MWLYFQGMPSLFNHPPQHHSRCQLSAVLILKVSSQSFFYCSCTKSCACTINNPGGKYTLPRKFLVIRGSIFSFGFQTFKLSRMALNLLWSSETFQSSEVLYISCSSSCQTSTQHKLVVLDRLQLYMYAMIMAQK